MQSASIQLVILKKSKPRKRKRYMVEEIYKL
jgi:hypothetical protein